MVTTRMKHDVAIIPWLSFRLECGATASRPSNNERDRDDRVESKIFLWGQGHILETDGKAATV